jgi:hypothetical protein
MNLELNHEVALKLTADPSLYDNVPFLLPLKEPTLSVHEKIKKAKVACTACARRKVMKVGMQIAQALASLIVAEATKPENLGLFKQEAKRIYGKDFINVRIQYKLADGGEGVLEF